MGLSQQQKLQKFVRLRKCGDARRCLPCGAVAARIAEQLPAALTELDLRSPARLDEPQPRLREPTLRRGGSAHRGAAAGGFDGAGPEMNAQERSLTARSGCCSSADRSAHFEPRAKRAARNAPLQASKSEQISCFLLRKSEEMRANFVFPLKNERNRANPELSCLRVYNTYIP